MSKDERFHTPGTLDLKQGIGILSNGTIMLTDAQLLVLTLNEICVLQGKGQFFWYPEHEHNLNRLPDMRYCGKQWTEDETNAYWNKSQMQRFEDSKADTYRKSLPTRTNTSMTVRVFPISSPNDTISWQENTSGNLILCYRDGTAYLDHLKTWEWCAERTAESTFARRTHGWYPEDFVPTPSYTVYWRDIPAPQLALRRFPDNEKIVQAVDEVWTVVNINPAQRLNVREGIYG